MAQSALATLGGIPLLTNPDQVRWTFTMKTTETNTLGGRVIQVLGTTLSDLTLSGAFGRGNQDKGDTEGWQQQVRFRDKVKSWALKPQETLHYTPIRFTYPPRGWDFQVYVKEFSDVHFAVDDFNPTWQLTLFPVDQDAAKVIRGIRDLYLRRLIIGIGWKQTTYNGPLSSEVAATLAGHNVEEYLDQRFQEAFDGTTPSTVTDAPAATPRPVAVTPTSGPGVPANPTIS